MLATYMRLIRYNSLEISSLRSRRLEVVGTRKNGRARRSTPCVSPSRAPVLSFARYFQAPATQARRLGLRAPLVARKN